jgi:hypothetical protein
MIKSSDRHILLANVLAFGPNLGILSRSNNILNGGFVLDVKSKADHNACDLSLAI